MGVEIRAVWGPPPECCGEAVNLAAHDARAMLRLLGYERRSCCGTDDPASFAERVAEARRLLGRSGHCPPELEQAFGSSASRWKSRLDRLEAVAEEAAVKRGKVSWA